MPKLKSQNKWKISQVTEHSTRRHKRYNMTKMKMYEMKVVVNHYTINRYPKKCKCKEKIVNYPGHCTICSTVFDQVKIYSSQPEKDIEIIIL